MVTVATIVSRACLIIDIYLTGKLPFQKRAVAR
jgi:hypothetical protein